MQRTISLTTSRQITLPSALLRLLGATPGSKLIANYDKRTNSIRLTRQRTLEESLSLIDNLNQKDFHKNPELAKNLKKYSGLEFEQVRALWEETTNDTYHPQEEYGTKH